MLVAFVSLKVLFWSIRGLIRIYKELKADPWGRRRRVVRVPAGRIKYGDTMGFSAKEPIISQIYRVILDENGNEIPSTKQFLSLYEKVPLFLPIDDLVAHIKRNYPHWAPDEEQVVMFKFLNEVL